VWPFLAHLLKGKHHVLSAHCWNDVWAARLARVRIIKKLPENLTPEREREIQGIQLRDSKVNSDRGVEKKKPSRSRGGDGRRTLAAAATPLRSSSHRAAA
jgi:hypothetical protein